MMSEAEDDSCIETRKRCVQREAELTLTKDQLLRERAKREELEMSCDAVRAEADKLIEERDRVIMAHQKKINTLVEKSKSDDAILEELKKKLEKSSAELLETKTQVQNQVNENSTLKQHLQQISAEAHKLYHRVIAQDKELNEKQGLEAHLHNKELEIEALQKQVAESQNNNNTFVTRIAALESELQNVNRRLMDTEQIATNQSDAFRQLEERYRESQVERAQEIERSSELNKTLLSLNEEFTRVSKENEQHRSTMATLQEHLTASLQESRANKEKYDRHLEDLKVRHEKNISDLKHDLKRSQKDYDALFLSHNALSGIASESKQRQFFFQEMESRFKLNLLFFEDLQRQMLPMILDMRVKIQEKDAAILTCQKTIHSLNEKAKDLDRQLVHYRAQSTDTESKLSEMLETSAATTSKLAHALQTVETLQAKNAEMESDNIYLKNHVETLSQELNEMDENIWLEIKKLEKINDGLKNENAGLRTAVAELSAAKKDSSTQLSKTRKELELLRREYEAQSNALNLTECELIATKTKESSFTATLRETNKKLDDAESKNGALRVQQKKLEQTVESLQNKLEEATEKYNLILRDKRAEIEALKERLTRSVELTEKQETSIFSTTKAIEDYEKNISFLKNAYSKIKEKSAQDEETLKKLQQEQEELLRQKRVTEEKVASLQEALSSKNKKESSKVLEEMKKLIDLCSFQETELQKLRRENVVMKNSLSMFVTTAPPKAETIFTERLNLTEGPRRHPRKRTESHTS